MHLLLVDALNMSPLRTINTFCNSHIYFNETKPAPILDNAKSIICLQRRKHPAFVSSILIFTDIITVHIQCTCVRLTLSFLFVSSFHVCSKTEDRRHFQCNSKNRRNLLLVLKIIINVESSCVTNLKGWVNEITLSEQVVVDKMFS